MPGQLFHKKIAKFPIVVCKVGMGNYIRHHFEQKSRPDDVKDSYSITLNWFVLLESTRYKVLKEMDI